LVYTMLDALLALVLLAIIMVHAVYESEHFHWE